MKDIIKFVVVLLILVLVIGLVYSILSPILEDFLPDETKDKTETKEPSETKEPTETTKPLTCEHTYPNVYTDGKCSKCGVKCNNHVWDLEGKCDSCRYPCPHSSYTNSICNVCKYGCSHSSWVAATGKCSTCKYSCLHTGAITTTDSTCEKVGSEVINCSTCGFKKTTEIPKKQHTYGNYEPFDGNEKEQHGKQCSSCKTWLSIANHTFKNGVCSVCSYECEHNYVDYVCEVCGYVCEHSYVLIEYYEPTCYNDAREQKECSHCGKIYYFTVDNTALGHNYISTGTVVSPTCTEYGYTEEECSRCGKSGNVDYVSPLGHDWEEYSTASTCTENGILGFRCSNCYLISKDGTYALADHDFANGSCTNCGAGDPNYDYECPHSNTQSVGDEISPCHYWEATECFDCGEEFGYSEYTSHDWDDITGSTCMTCGYSEPLD